MTTHRKLLQIKLTPVFTEVEVDDDGIPTLSESRNGQEFMLTGKIWESMGIPPELARLVQKSMEVVFVDRDDEVEGPQRPLSRQQRRALERSGDLPSPPVDDHLEPGNGHTGHLEAVRDEMSDVTDLPTVPVE